MVDDMFQDDSSRPSLATVSVSDFFRQINWYGRSSLGGDGLDAVAMPYETVGQFFSTFPWQGMTPTVPADDWEPTKDNNGTIHTAEDSLTLEDLSALF